MRPNALLAACMLGMSTLVVTPALAQTTSDAVVVEDLAGGLNHPWGMALLPDGRLLVTERAGDLRILGTDHKLSKPVEGTPKVFAEGQGGLLDVALDPDFKSNNLVYLSFAEPGKGGASTAVGRGRLRGNKVEDFQVIFRQEPKVSGPNHFGGRIIFSPTWQLFLTLGDRYKFDPAQDLSNHIGTIVRINPDGSIPPDNPFVGHKAEPVVGQKAEPAIWSYGHRNIQSAAFNPKTGALWVAEMGPKGGDELNLAEPGRNYGWPLVSWGTHYDGKEIPDPPTRPEFADAAIQWTPVIAPSGMIFYSGDAFPEWRGSALIGGLRAQGLVRVTSDGGKIKEAERIPLGARIRDVEQAPDGTLYVITDADDGHVWRLKPHQNDGR